jgi:hypothetical protein
MNMNGPLHEEEEEEEEEEADARDRHVCTDRQLQWYVCMYVCMYVCITSTTAIGDTRSDQIVERKE